MQICSRTLQGDLHPHATWAALCAMCAKCVLCVWCVWCDTWCVRCLLRVMCVMLVCLMCDEIRDVCGVCGVHAICAMYATHVRCVRRVRFVRCAFCGCCLWFECDLIGVVWCVCVWEACLVCVWCVVCVRVCEWGNREPMTVDSRLLTSIFSIPTVYTVFQPVQNEWKILNTLQYFCSNFSESKKYCSMSMFLAASK